MTVETPKPGEEIVASLFPLPDVVLFPGMVLPLHVFEPRYRELVRDTITQANFIAVPRLLPGYERHYHDSPAVFPVMGVGRIVRHERLSDGRYDIEVQGMARMQSSCELQEHPYRVARGQVLANREVGHTGTSLHAELTKLLAKLRPFWSEAGQELERTALGKDSLAGCTDVLAPLFQTADDRQRLLEELDPSERAMMLCGRLHELWADVERLDPRPQRASRLN